MWFSYVYILFQKIIQNYFNLFTKSCGGNKFVTKNNKSNGKVSMHYRIIGLYSEDFCNDFFFCCHKLFGFFCHISTPKLSKSVTLLPLHIKLSKEFLLSSNHWDILRSPHPSQCLIDCFDKRFYIPTLVKGWGGISNSI